MMRITVSLQEFQAANERIFKAMDANKDGVRDSVIYERAERIGSAAVARAKRAC